MGRKLYNFLEKQGLNNDNNKYEAPTWDELDSILGQQYYSFSWSREDELMVLEKLFEFSTQNKNNPNYYTTQFYNYVNKMLSVQLFENQLSYMIYRLRKRYLDHNEQDLDSHGLKVLELSRKIWKVDSNNIIDEGWPKTKVLKGHYEKYLRAYVVEELGFEADRLSPSVIEEIKKDWEHFQFVEDEIRSMQNRFSLRLFELKTNMHNTPT